MKEFHLEKRVGAAKYTCTDLDDLEQVLIPLQCNAGQSAADGLQNLPGVR